MGAATIACNSNNAVSCSNCDSSTVALELLSVVVRYNSGTNSVAKQWEISCVDEITS